MIEEFEVNFKLFFNLKFTGEYTEHITYLLLLNRAYKSFIDLATFCNMSLDAFVENEYKYFVATESYKDLIPFSKAFKDYCEQNKHQRLSFLCSLTNDYDLETENIILSLCQLQSTIISLESPGILIVVWNIISNHENNKMFDFLLFTIEQIDDDWFVHDISYYLQRYVKKLSIEQKIIVFEKIKKSPCLAFKEDMSDFFPHLS